MTHSAVAATSATRDGVEVSESSQELEVDSLAKRTTRASDEMHQRAAELRKTSEAAAAALLRVDGVIRELDAHRGEISSAPEGAPQPPTA